MDKILQCAVALLGAYSVYVTYFAVVCYRDGKKQVELNTRKLIMPGSRWHLATLGEDQIVKVIGRGYSGTVEYVIEGERDGVGSQPEYAVSRRDFVRACSTVYEPV